jgi:predicted nucleic acid-binding protein
MKKDKKFKDFEDTMQYVLAKKVNADFIITNDKGTPSRFTSYQNTDFSEVLMVVRERLELSTSGL